MRTFSLSFVVLAAGCAGPIRDVDDPLVPLRARIALEDDGDTASLLAAVDESLAWIAAKPEDPERARQRSALTALRDFLVGAPTPRALADFVATHFEPKEARGGTSERVLFTGYYEPVIEASLVKSAEYATPIFGPPPDLVEVRLADFHPKYGKDKIVGRLDAGTFVPYHTREDITVRRVLDESLAIAWAKDPVALFFAEVQGSATLLLPDGSRRRIGYVAKNGRPYKSIGAKLIDDQKMKREDVSMQSLKAWLLANGNDLLVHNESFVFFRFLDASPLGSLGRPVTPLRSIATDAALFPKGALAFLEVDVPMPDGSVKALRRFVLNQDTGGAIVGAGRADIFFGQGELAEFCAGHLKGTGRLVFFLPKPRRLADPHTTARAATAPAPARPN